MVYDQSNFLSILNFIIFGNAKCMYCKLFGPLVIYNNDGTMSGVNMLVLRNVNPNYTRLYFNFDI